MGDGTETSPIASAECRLVDLAGNPILNEQGQPFETIADENGIYLFQNVPLNIQVFVICNPPGFPNLILATFVSTVGQEPGSSIQNQNVEPSTTVFTNNVAGGFLQAEQEVNLEVIEQSFLTDITGLRVRVTCVDAQGTEVPCDDPNAVAVTRAEVIANPQDPDVGMIAFTSASLFKSLLQEQGINPEQADFIEALNTIIFGTESTVTPEELEALGVPAARSGQLAADLNASIASTANALQTGLGTATQRAKVQVVVTDQNGPVAGATVITLPVDDTTVNCVNPENRQDVEGIPCSEITNENGEALLELTGISKTEVTPVRVFAFAETEEAFLEGEATINVVTLSTVQANIVLESVSE